MTPLFPYFDYRIRQRPPALILDLAGELDFGSVHALRLSPALTDAEDLRCLVIDASRLKFCDVAGLRRLRQILACARGRGWHARIEEPPRSLRRAAQAAGFGTDWLN